MAAFNFPASPSNGDNYTLNGVTYQYDGTKWVRFSSSVGAQGAAGSTGPSGPTGAQGAQGLQGAQAHISTSAPSSGVSNGDLWWDSDGGDLSIYYNDGSSAQWVDINTGPRGAQGGTGPTGAQGAAGAQGATGAAGSNATISNNADNRVITGGSGTNLNGESGLTYNGTRLDVTTGDLQVIGGEGGNAELRIVADQGDDGADYWRFQSAASDNKLNIATYASGSWVDKVSITSTGTTFTGEVSITGQNLTLQGGHPNLYLTDTDHDSDFVISNSNSSFVIKDIQNNVNRIKIFTAGNTEIVGDLDIGDSIRHIGDTDTKIRFPAADTITAETGGTERLRIEATGNTDVKKGLRVSGEDAAWGSGSEGAFMDYYASGSMVRLGHVNGASGSAKSIVIYTGGSEKLRIASDGQIQAGTSAPTYLKYTGSAVPTNNNNGTLLGSNNIGLIGQYSSLNMPFDHSTATTSGAWWMLGRSAGTSNEWGLYTRSGGQSNLLSVWKVVGNSNGTTDYQTFSTGSNSERVRITSGGNFGIGTNNPQVRLELKDNSSNNYGTTLRFSQGYNSVFSEIASNFGGSMTLNAGQGTTSAIMHFQVNDDEKMRLNNNGALLIGSTTQGSDELFKIFTDSTGPEMMQLRNNAASSTKDMITMMHVSNSGATMIRFKQTGGLSNVGSITTSSSATAYNTSSDYRLKENEVLISDGITRLKTLKPYRFNFKTEPNKTVDGFFAHEVTAVPEAVHGEKDAVETTYYAEGDNIPEGKAIGDIKEENVVLPQSLDYAKLTPLLTAALQEAITKIETLETKVAALEGS